MTTILVVEDDPAIADAVKVILRAEHYNVLTASTGSSGLEKARHEGVDLILLDLRLPDRNGEDVCRELRSSGITVPIVMVTSKRTEMDKVVGLEAGADDYITKPYGAKELIARVRAHLRRGAARGSGMEEIAFGDVRVDFRRQEADKAGEMVRLTSREFAVLRFLVSHEGEVVTRDMLLNEVWGYERYPTTRTVDNFLLSLRKKLESRPDHPEHLLTVHTSGYKFKR